MLNNLVMFLIWVAAVFLILLILVQRGRGGGLAGAFGGMGGQSAFGTKAGDVFTKITIVTAAIWMLLCVAAVLQFNTETDFFGGTVGQEAQPATPVVGATTLTPEGTVTTPVGGSDALGGSGSAVPGSAVPATSAPATTTPATATPDASAPTTSATAPSESVPATASP